MSLPDLPPSGGTMTVTYGVGRKVKVPMWDEDALRAYAAAAVRVEREACATACEHQPHWVACADAIRARGNT